MATEKEILKWKLFNKKFHLLVRDGIKKDLVRPYEDSLIDRLNNIYYGGVSASILILHNGMTGGRCYDRSSLLTTGFKESDNYRLVYADIDSIKLNPTYLDAYHSNKLGKMYADHCFVEKTEDDITWVYDTAVGLVFEKNLYYKIEKPKIRHINNKEKTRCFMEEELQECNIEKDKYSLPLILPNLEKNMKAVQPFYQSILEREIKNLKEKTKYDDICREIEEDIERLGLKEDEGVKALIKIAGVK